MNISVIIPVFNKQNTISSCLTTLLSQSLKPLEIILIDDGSTDKSIARIKQFTRKHSFIKLLTKSHQGPAKARNLGAKKAKADILVFVDADMEFAQDFLKTLTKPIISKKVKGAWSNNELVKNWHNIWARCWNYNQNRSTSKMIGDAKTQKKVFRAILKSEFDKVNGFDSTGYTDDWSLVQKLNYQPTVTSAKFYHHNPATLLKVFTQAVWIGKRQYKLAKLGALIAIIRANAGFSLIIGLLKSIRFFTPQFIIFKLVYDLGIMFGAIQSLSGKKY